MGKDADRETRGLHEISVIELEEIISGLKQCHTLLSLETTLLCTRYTNGKFQKAGT